MCFLVPTSASPLHISTTSSVPTQHFACGTRQPTETTMAGGQFLTLLHASSRCSMVKPSRPFFYNPIKQFGQTSKGNHSRLMEERAPSTAEEFQRVAEEKAREAQQRVASQTVDKACDGTEEATIGDSKVGSVKNKHKKHEPGADCRRRGN